MSWIYLIIAGFLEAFWAIGLKYTQGFTRPVPTLLVVATIAVSLFLLSVALRTIPVGTGYAVWVSIGIFGATILEAVLFRQPFRFMQVFFLALLLVSVIGLKLFTPSR